MDQHRSLESKCNAGPSAGAAAAEPLWLAGCRAAAGLQHPNSLANADCLRKLGRLRALTGAALVRVNREQGYVRLIFIMIIWQARSASARTGARHRLA